jgi:hypothetical protein
MCGRQGYKPVILASDFFDRDSNLLSEKRAIYENLTKAYDPLQLD